MRFRYPSLFPRMALHIGAALAAFVLIGAAILGLIAALELRGYIQTRQSSLGEEAAKVLSEGGHTALQDWLKNTADIPADVSVYILDSNSDDILGRQLPGQYASFVRESVIGEAAGTESNFLPVRLAPQLISPDGTRYAFLVLPKGISLWGSPAITMGLLLVALAVIFSVAWLIARAFSRPINELQIAVRELASGDTGARAPQSVARRDDELGALATDFNLMAEQLAELIKGREGLLREMSHELRSPLARLQAAIALASERNSLDNSERGRIDQEIQRMNRVIGEILRYSSMDAAVSNRRQLVRVDKLLKELIQVEDIEATDRGCELRLTTEQNLAVIGDPELLHSGFENILRNAIRYAPNGTTVQITAWKNERRDNEDSPGNILVEISDEGPGIVAEHLEDIFQPYFRINSGNHDPDSTGLGLAIVRRVFSKHGGSVYASQKNGGGLTLTVKLPAVALT